MIRKRSEENIEQDSMLEKKKDLTIQWYPGHMVKAKRNIEADLALVDMLIQVVDARAPRSSQNPELSRLWGAKPHLLVLNKKDLADEKATRFWLEYYRQKGLQVCTINAAQKQGIKELLSAIKRINEPLMQKLEAKGRLRRSVRAMIVGIPNCGKSTVINSLAPQAAAKTGNKPGVTKGRQWVKTAIGLELLDTPGVLWPKFADYQIAFRLAVIGSISDSVFPLYQVSEQLVQWLMKNYPQSLLDRYDIADLPEHPQEVLEAIGRRRGLLAAGNQVRLDDAAVLFLQEFRSGKLGRFTLDIPKEV